MSDLNPVTEKVRVVRWRMANEKFRFSEELRIIPGWAITLAAIAFLGIQILMHGVGFRHDPHPPPLPLRLFFGLLVGMVAAFLIMLIGYVNRDAKRRGMRSGIWTAIVLFVPYAIGLILYFVFRQPLQGACPQCGATVSALFNFCPKCKFNLNPACPGCKHSVRPGDRYCPFCAHDLSADNPAGTRPLTPVTPGAGV